MQKTPEINQQQRMLDKINMLEREIDERKLRIIAIRDILRLQEIVRIQPQLRQDQAWVAMMAKAARYSNGIKPHVVPCLVCCRISSKQWSQLGFQIENEGLHCDKHTAEFHDVCVWTHNCCQINYHPSHQYEWRNQPQEARNI